MSKKFAERLPLRPGRSSLPELLLQVFHYSHLEGDCLDSGVVLLLDFHCVVSLDTFFSLLFTQVFLREVDIAPPPLRYGFNNSVFFADNFMVPVLDLKVFFRCGE